MADSVDNYLGLTHEDMCAVNAEEVMSSNSVRLTTEIVKALHENN